ncbi:MAG: metal ABC transporter ATP-binding protein [Ruminococcaceae bacterium]|nr:metal ABC transporter ATP-binding protein [Oscillospiraceae bacterium]
MALISCQDVFMTYENTVALRDLTFSVEAGDYLCILGENGSGKSTLIKGLLGLKAPARGSIRFGDGLRQNEIGYLPQQTQIQREFPASVREVVLSGCLNRGKLPFYTKKDRMRAAENLEKMELLGLERRSYRELSGGQQQRVLLARALCATSKILLLDEPVSGLDPVATAHMYRLLHRLNREEGITIVMVSHDVHSAADSATRILHLKTEMRFFGTAEDYFRSDLGKHFLGEEYHA